MQEWTQELRELNAITRETIDSSRTLIANVNKQLKGNGHS